MTKKLDTLPLAKGQAQVCCLACGQNLVVQAGHEDHALVDMRLHAQEHEQELSPAFRAASENDLVTDDLVSTFTWALPREELLD